tara:strand:- start:249 stop:533 length:285 start_codon:yes stop_codon:yes gene_type:complete
MDKKIVFTLLIISTIGSIVMLICIISSYLNGDNYYLLFVIMFFMSLLSLHLRRKDYKYLTGKFTYKEFRRYERYEYWFLMYGEKAYDKYLEKFK